MGVRGKGALPVGSNSPTGERIRIRPPAILTQLNYFRVVALAGSILCMGAPAYAMQPQPVPKSGSCPSGYNTSGNYCAPSANARFAVVKVGNCPSGYNTSGGYCLAGPNAKFVVPKQGNCPSGYNTSGDYCLSSK